MWEKLNKGLYKALSLDLRESKEARGWDLIPSRYLRTTNEPVKPLIAANKKTKNSQLLD